MRDRFLGILKVYEEEIGLLLWTTTLLFIVRSSGMILNNYAETAFLKRYGVEFMPVVNMVNAIVTLLITGFLTTFLSRISGARLLSYIFLISGSIALLIRMLIPAGFDLLYPILFMVKSQFELIQALLFWNMCNDLYNTRQSKRLFPLLTAGGVMGLILGSFATPYFAKNFHLDNLLYLYLFTTLMGYATIQGMGRNYGRLIFPKKETGEKNQKRNSMAQEMKNILPLIKDSVLVKIVLVLTFMPNVIIPIMNYQFNYAVNDQFASEASMIEFFGYFRGGLNIVSLFILLFVGRIYGRWGLPVALMFHPFNYIIALSAFLFRFDVLAAMYARMSTTIIRTTINVPANSILIGLFPQEYRNKIRPFLRGTVVRMALFTGSTLILISTPLFHPKYLTLVALPFLLAWMAAPFFLTKNYSKILLDLISKNLLDIKSLNQSELGQIFNHDKTLKDLEASLIKARGQDAIWYAKLIKNFAPDRLDALIPDILDHNDETTRIALVKMLSKKFLATSTEKLIPHLDPKLPELSIAIFKHICQSRIGVSPPMDLAPYLTHTHPVVRGFAGACYYYRNPEDHKAYIDQWLRDPANFQSGIIAAGLSHKHSYIDPLLALLEEKKDDAIVPDIIIALSRLGARELNPVVYTYLGHPEKRVRLAALDALDINDDTALKKAITLMGDASDTLHHFAKEKIKTAEYHNDFILVESLGIFNSRTRKGVFELLESLDIKDFEVLVFAKESLKKSYEFLAMAQNLSRLKSTPMTQLAVAHLKEKKEVVLENIIRVLALHDKSGRMQMAWRGIFSTNTRQRANAIELLNDILDRNTFNAMIPLLESPTIKVALAEGKKSMKLPRFDRRGSQVVQRLLSSEDWVDIIMGLGIIRQSPGILDDAPASVAHDTHPLIPKEMSMTLTPRAASAPNASEISLGEKVLLLREIEIFSGLSASELAAIAAVTTESEFKENEEVIQQNTVGETVFLIIEGKVSVAITTPDGKEEIIDYMESGNSFGEMALVDDAPRSATIRTTSPCRFLILHKQEFKETAMEFPRIALQICSVLSQRIRGLHARVNSQND